MKIFIAKDAGYCFGVRDAVNLAYESAEKYGDVYMLGDIVHNENVIKDLNQAGAKVVSSLDEVPDGKPILFRAHGTSIETWSDADKNNMNIIDATCPLVKEIYEEVVKFAKEGRKIIIIGDHGHDEVVGISSQVDNTIIVSNTDEAMKLRKMKRVGVVTQSTQTIENVQAIINILMTKVFDLRFVNTICFPTKRNQNQIKELSKECDVMIVIGSFASANSKRLTLLAQEINKKTFQVTCADEIKPKWFDGANSVGLSAGASTPDSIINEVLKRLKSINKNSKEMIYG